MVATLLAGRRTPAHVPCARLDKEGRMNLNIFGTLALGAMVAVGIALIVLG